MTEFSVGIAGFAGGARGEKTRGESPALPEVNDQAWTELTELTEGVGFAGGARATFGGGASGEKTRGEGPPSVEWREN